MEWVSLGKSVNGDENLIDVSSLRVAGAAAAWFKTVYAAHSAKETLGPDANKWWGKSVERAAFNCSDETTRAEAITVYYEDGTNGSDPAASFPKSWKPVTPETMRDAEMRFIARGSQNEQYH